MKRLIKELAHFFFIGLRVHLQSNVQREAVNCALFKLPFRYLCCYVICYHVTFFAMLVTQELSFHRFLCGSSASCQLCSNRSFRATIDARRCQPSLKPKGMSPWMKPAGGWLFPDRRMEGCWQRIFLLPKSIQTCLVFQNSFQRHLGQIGLDWAFA